MTNPEYRGARGSNAGDDYHELWAVRHSLALLEQDSGLTLLTVEGLRPQDEVTAGARAWDGIDCALYFGGTAVADCERIVIEQVKYSGSDPDGQWTLARLTSNSAKKTNNSVIRRLADAFQAIYASRGSSPSGITIRLVSNQAVAESVIESLRGTDSSANPSGKSESATDRAKIFEASGLSAESFQHFVASLDLNSCTGSRFAVKETVLKTIASWIVGDARAKLDQLAQFVRKKMLPESKGEVITRESVLLEFGFSDSRALFPCPAEIRRVASPVSRSAAVAVIEGMRTGDQFICLHGIAGCGKTTVLQEIDAKLPDGSAMIVFDCYGAGRYLDSDAFRHRPMDAFLQLSNDLASRLRVPLLLTRSGDTDYPRAFRDRLTSAAELVASTNKDAMLVICVDAADNSVTAAASLAPPERSFALDFVNLGGLPENVRLVVTARTGRLDDLCLPPRFKLFELKGFTLIETGLNIGRIWRGVSEAWREDFHTLSIGNPRVQSYAIDFGSKDLNATLNFLRPHGKALDQIFDARLSETLLRSGGKQEIDGFCAALVELPRPIPLRDLSEITGLSGPQIRDICADLAPAIRVTDTSIGFADEDFERFVRAKVGNVMPTRSRIADWFMTRKDSDSYAATHVAAALYRAGRVKEILQLLEAQSGLDAIDDPLLKRETQLQRIRIAVQSSAEAADTVLAMRTILAGAQALKTDAAIRELVVANPDLAAAFMNDSASRMILLDSKLIQHHGPLLSHQFLEDARTSSKTMAREDMRRIEAWLERRKQDIEQKQKNDPQSHHYNAWDIKDSDVAAQIEAILLLWGARTALEQLSRWRPHELKLRVARILVQRLLASGRSDLVQECLREDLIPEPWSLALSVPLAVSGGHVELERIKKAVSVVVRHPRFLPVDRTMDTWRADLTADWLDTVVTACEILTAFGHGAQTLPILSRIATKELRQIESLSLFQTSRLDLMLRTYALSERSAGRTMTTETFLVDSLSDPTTSGSVPAKPKVPDREKAEEVKSFVGSLVPLYTARVEIINGKVGTQAAESVLNKSIGSFASNSWRFASKYGADRIRDRMSSSIANLAFLPQIDPKMLLARSLGVFESHIDPFGSDEISVLSVLTQNPSVHADALKIIIERWNSIKVMKTVAQEKIDATLKLARFLIPISRPEAKALFTQAHAMTEELDLEAIDQLKCVGSLCVRAKTAMSDANARQMACVLVSVATDAAVRLSDHEGFPWRRVVETLTTLNLPVALAALGRWDDAGLADRDTSLEPLLMTAIVMRSVTCEVAAAFLPLLDAADTELLKSMIVGLPTSDDNKTEAVLEGLAKDELLRFEYGWRRDLIDASDAIRSESIGNRIWMNHLRKTIEFNSQLNSGSGRAPNSMEAFKARETQSSETAIVLSGRYVTVSEITQTLAAANKEMRSRDSYVSATIVLERIRETVSVNDRVQYLDALAGLSRDDVSESEVAAAIVTTLHKWVSPAVTDWCERSLPKFLMRSLSTLTAYLRYDETGPIFSLLASIPNPIEQVPKILTQAVALNVDAMTAGSVYETVGLIANHMKPTDAAALVDQYLPRLLKRIPANDLDLLDIDDVPTTGAAAIGRYLFAMLSDCDVRVRWRASHAIRRLAQYGQIDLLNALTEVYERQVETTFRISTAPFYWLAARLWLMIAFYRIAVETPSALANFGPFIFEISVTNVLPHVLIRAFAKDAAHELVNRGILKLSQEQLEMLDRANTGGVPRKESSNPYGHDSSSSPSTEESPRRFQFDSMDTLPYWYTPAVRVFADLSLAEFTGVAETWIVDRWNAPTERQYWNSDPRRHRFPERSWGLWSNDHGSRPTIERYDTYLEWNGMCCAIGELLQSRPLLAKNPNSYSGFEEWLRSELLSSPPFWLADFRGPKPLESRFLLTSPPDGFTDGVSDDEFLLEIGIGAARKGMIVVEGLHRTGSSDFALDAQIQSALVQPETANALLRALQTIEEPARYGIPYDRQNEGLQIDNSPYRLLGWLASRDSGYGIDKGDPLRNGVNGIGYAPGSEARKSLKHELRADGTMVWQKNGEVVSYVYEQWSDGVEDENARSSLVYSRGERLWASVETLKEYLRQTGFDLILDVRLDRRKGRRSYEQVHQEKAAVERFGRLLLLRKEGSIETAEGCIGTWHTPST
jgi:hypothetical protein